MRYIYQFWDYDDVELVAFDIPDHLVRRFNNLIDNKPIIWGDEKAIEVRGSVDNPIKRLKSLKQKVYKRKFYLDAWNYYNNQQKSELSVSASGSIDPRILTDTAEEYADQMMQYQKSVERKNKRIDKLIEDIEND